MSSSTSSDDSPAHKGELYTRMKIFHFSEKLHSLQRSTDEIGSPLHVRIKPTNVCNHRCCYCAYRAEDLQLGTDMNKSDSIPREKMLEIVDDLATMGVGAVTFSGGGEPLCYPHLAEVLRRLSETPVKFAALTNGALLEGEIAEVFARHATWLRVSIDGWDNKSYATYRHVPEGEFSKVVRNMESFKAIKGKCYLGVTLIVDRKNAKHVYDLASMAKALHVDSIKISPCIVDNEGARNNSYHQPIFDTVRQCIDRCMAELADNTFEVFDAYHSLEENFQKKYTWCPYLQILPVIGADLNVYSCQDKAYNLAEGLLGSIKDISFKEFWFSDKARFFEIDPSISCNHHCVSNGKNKMVLEYLDADREHLSFV